MQISHLNSFSSFKPNYFYILSARNTIQILNGSQHIQLLPNGSAFSNIKPILNNDVSKTWKILIFSSLSSNLPFFSRFKSFHYCYFNFKFLQPRLQQLFFQQWKFFRFFLPWSVIPIQLISIFTAGTAFSSYYFSLFLVLPFFLSLTTSAYFHRFKRFWYQNIQLLQEIYAMTFGVYDFYTLY